MPIDRTRILRHPSGAIQLTRHLSFRLPMRRRMSQDAAESFPRMASTCPLLQANAQAAGPLPTESPESSAQFKSQSQRGIFSRLNARVFGTKVTGDSIMEDKKKLTVTEPVANAESDPYTPRKLTLAENAILTVKVLGMLGVIGAAIWGFNFWISAQ
jgi:hypothetical protein